MSVIDIFFLIFLYTTMVCYIKEWFYIDLLPFIIQINMSSSFLKLLLALTLFVIITECRPKLRTRKTKACKDDDDCGTGFSCIQTPNFGKMCAKAKVEAVKPSKYKTTDYKDSYLIDTIQVFQKLKNL